MATSCRLKLEIAEWSCNKTEVSRTNILDFLAMDFSFKVIHPIHNPEKNQRELFTPHCQFLYKLEKPILSQQALNRYVDTSEGLSTT